jgi:hypothetical protein
VDSDYFDRFLEKLMTEAHQTLVDELKELETIQSNLMQKAQVLARIASSLEDLIVLIKVKHDRVRDLMKQRGELISFPLKENIRESKRRKTVKEKSGD